MEKRAVWMSSSAIPASRSSSTMAARARAASSRASLTLSRNASTPSEMTAMSGSPETVPTPAAWMPLFVS